ncbi:MAG: chromate resistance protein ChrB domain-containing protein [Betaproteobacteria bacterium]
MDVTSPATPAAAAIPVSAAQLAGAFRAFPPPALLDVRRAESFARDPVLIPHAIRCDPGAVDAWSHALEPWREVVVYCVHGHELGQGVAAALARGGLTARYLAGGLEGWRAFGGQTVPAAAPSRWVTRARPKIDRIACPWLVRRFVDPAAEFFYVPNAEVRAFAAANNAEPYDVPDVKYTHDGARCSFDAFIRIHALDDRALDDLARIVRGADTGALDLAHESSGLVAASLGLSRMFHDDHAMLRWGMLMYDALYAWCREARGETHGWNPALLRAA